MRGKMPGEGRAPDLPSSPTVSVALCMPPTLRLKGVLWLAHPATLSKKSDIVTLLGGEGVSALTAPELSNAAKSFPQQASQDDQCNEQCGSRRRSLPRTGMTGSRSHRFKGQGGNAIPHPSRI